ncbi:WavE lipopolysaccharide synthesis [Candidatus Nanopelagicaceae bacterium]
MEKLIGNPDVTFVIQGPLMTGTNDQNTRSLIKAIEQHFVGSPIIFSTWKSQEMSGFGENTKTVFSDDPGAHIGWRHSVTWNNVNRQIVSTVRGLNQVKTPYAVKLRSDTTIVNNNLISLMKKRPTRSNQTKFDLLEEIVIASNVTSYNPNFQIRRIHHPCDWIFAGLTEDLKKIWNVPLMPEEWFQWFTDNNQKDASGIHADQVCRFDPEEYVWSSFLKKYIDIEFENSFDFSISKLEISESLIARNLQMHPIKSLGMRFSKHADSSRVLPFSYSPYDWRKIAKKNSIHIVQYVDFYSFKVFLLRLKIRFNMMKTVLKLK